eukprot:11519825-Alexandrium_andersonii.AAC.1
MSASLVGSEMCIRDRGVPVVWSECWGSAQSTARRGRGVAPEGPREEPVSYTHLTLPTICSV